MQLITLLTVYAGTLTKSSSVYMGEGVAYDAISMGSYAHGHRLYWQNLIPGPLLHEMVEKRFLMRSVDQQVQDVLKPGLRRPASTTGPLDRTP
jgi:hypothetical protein